MLYLYQPGDRDGDLLISKWWLNLDTSGEMDLVFVKRPSLGKFLDNFKPPNVLIIDVGEDDGEIEIACWLEPVFSGAAVGLWVKPELRGTRRVLQALGQLFEIALQDYVVLFVITKQDKVKALAERLGFQLIAAVPGLYGGELGWIMLLDKQRFDAVYDELVQREILTRRVA